MTQDHARGTRLITREGATHVAVPRLVIAIANAAGDKRVEIGQLAVRVGTDPRNDIVVHDEAVSAKHLEIVAESDGLLLRDLGSRNGTRVDGYRVREIYLKREATIEIGETTLKLSALDEDGTLEVSPRTNFGDLLGHSPAMRAAFAVLEQAAKTDATILLLGESGTGKELAARALHERSKRKDGPFVVFDAGAAAASLVESQLFGHARGAFTGANEAREGVLEAASGGTLVLDEIGELPLDLQPRLLRALESRTITRIGENKPRAIDVRFVASTHRNLEEEVAAGRFRSDLFFRLAVIAVRLPPLRDRPEEIPRLVKHFASRIGGEDAPPIPEGVIAALARHTWPGNVRELRNVVERLVSLPDVDASLLLPSAGPVGKAGKAGKASPAIETSTSMPFHEAKQQFTDRFERAYLAELLEQHGHNLSEAARVAGLSRQSCYRLIEKHGLRADDQP